MLKKYAFLCLCFMIGKTLVAQDSEILLNHDLYHYIDRLDIRNYTGQTIHTDIKPYGRQAVSDIFAATDSTGMSCYELRWHRKMRHLADDEYAQKTNEKGYIWGLLYKNKRDFYSHTDDKFRIYVNPAMQFFGGGEYYSGKNIEMLSVNSRGIQVRGDFNRKVGFFTEVYDNVMRVPQFVMQKADPDGVVTRDERLNLPGEAYVKRFSRNDNSLDFFSSRAYVTYSPIKQMRMKFGYDRAFWGNGNQSMFLSDNPSNCLALDINTRVWKLEYTNRFAQMIDYFKGKNDSEGAFPRKYAVFHQLSFKPTRNLSISAFESIVYNPVLPNGKRGFELQYMNPIIFYRSIEQAIGSSDNGFIGFSAKYNFLNHFQAYGQFLIDDFRFSDFKNGLIEEKRPPGSRYAKTAYQAGFKYIDMFNISTLDMQVEFNNARPYLYQHYNASSNYTHYGQSLGYGLGGNARDLTMTLRYHPFPQWNIEAGGMYGVKGTDKNGDNYGGDVTHVYNENLPSTGAGNWHYYVGIGNKVNILQAYGRITYQILDTDMYVEMEGRYRQEDTFKSAGIWGGLRMNLAPRRFRY